MSWADGFYDGTYGTKTTNIGPAWIYYDRKFLETVVNKLRMVPLGQARPLPEGNGKIIEFFRYLNLAVSVSNATLTEGVHPDATTFKMQDIQATIGEYGAFVQIASLLKSASIDQKMDGITDILAEHGATILDRLCHMEVASNGGYLLRSDYATATSSTYKGTVDSSTSTETIDTDLSANSDYGDANDDLNQSVITMLSGTAYGQSRPVTDYVQSTGAMTVSPAWDVTPVAGDTYRVTSVDAIASGDKLTYENTKRSVALLRWHKAMPSDEGAYVAVVDPFVIEGLQDDTVWKNLQEYRTDVDGIFKGEIGAFNNIRFVQETNQFTCLQGTIGTAGTAYGPGAAGANYSAAGEVTLVPIMGKNAYGVTNFSKDGTIDEPMIIIKTPGKHSTDQPLNRFSTAGWVVPAVYKGLNPMHLINMAVYNSALAA